MLDTKLAAAPVAPAAGTSADTPEVRPGTGKYQLECGSCGAVVARSLTFRCPECHGPVEVRYDLSRVRLRPDSGACPEEVFFDLLPLRTRRHLQPGASVRTPTRRAESLGRALGLRQLWLKDETRQPTGSTKDRLAAVVVPVLREFGITEFATASTGNTAIALARAAARDAGMTGHFFLAADSGGSDLIDTAGSNELHMVPGTYVDAMAASASWSTEGGTFAEGGFFSWARREGLKLAYLEAFTQLPEAPDVVVQSVSSGMGMLAAHKAAAELQQLGLLRTMPRMLMTQQDTCAPMARAWQAGKAELTDADVVTRPTGLATAILLGDARESYPFVRAVAKDTGGDIIEVPQDDLRWARDLLWRLEGIDACYASAAAIAGVRAQAESGAIGADEVVLINLSGSLRRCTAAAAA